MKMVTHNIEIFISLLIFHFKQRGYNVHLLSQLSYTFSFNSKVKCQWCGSNVLNKSGKKSNVIWLFHYHDHDIRKNKLNWVLYTGQQKRFSLLGSRHAWEQGHGEFIKCQITMKYMLSHFLWVWLRMLSDWGYG